MVSLVSLPRSFLTVILYRPASSGVAFIMLKVELFPTVSILILSLSSTLIPLMYQVASELLLLPLQEVIKVKVLPMLTLTSDGKGSTEGCPREDLELPKLSWIVAVVVC